MEDLSTDPKFPGDRGFAAWDSTLTSYGAEVRIYESSAASGPHIWLAVDQPPPKTTSPPEMEETHASAHMSLDQAEEIHAKLGAAIDFMKNERGWV